MAVITAYKCDHTGKIFEDKAKYQNHLKVLSRERCIKRKLQAEADEITNWFTNLQNTVETLDELKAAIIQNQEWFWKAVAKDKWGFGRSSQWDDIGKVRKGVALPIPKLVRFNTFDLRWSDSASNSHSCPKDGVQNWGGREVLKDGTPAPRGYPGWVGRIDWLIEWPKEWDGVYLGSDLFNSKATCIHTGTGGGGGYNKETGFQSFGYSIEIFASDWPAMWKRKQQDDMWKQLGGK